MKRINVRWAALVWLATLGGCSPSVQVNPKPPASETVEKIVDSASAAGTKCNKLAVERYILNEGNDFTPEKDAQIQAEQVANRCVEKNGASETSS